MSMSQEEIEALMSGLDIQDDDSSEVEEEDVPAAIEEVKEEENNTMSEDDIAALIAQTDIPSDDAPQVEEVAPEPVMETAADESLDDILNNFEEDSDDTSSDVDEENIDDILADIDGITEVEPVKEEPVKSAPVEKTPESPSASADEAADEAIGRTWTDKQIDQGNFPHRVEKEHKVVNQLSQVANDSEEQASKIFDVLSFILDENNVIQKNTKELDGFVTKQVVLLETLCKKFPNVAAFSANLELAKSMQQAPKDIATRVDNENTQLFQAMELMQFHDINRQKIERVMAVIKKLSTYLNNLFEDETGYHDVATAKHIHGDSNNDLVDEADLDALIAEFAK